MAKIGVLLSGCGYLDGAEIHEAVLTLLAVHEAGAEAVCMAPDIEQSKVVNHITGEDMPEKRNVLVEAARIARGEIRDIADVKGGELDAFVMPGGYGAALNLSDFAVAGPDMKVHPEVERMISEIHNAGKPIGTICISPAIVAKLIPGVKLTIGDDEGTSQALEKMGCKHENCVVTGIVVDDEHRVVSTPAYMLGPWVNDVWQGIRECVREVLQRVNTGAAP